MIYIIAVFTLVVLTYVAWLGYKTNTTTLTKLVALPLIIIIAFLSGQYYIQQLGTPIKNKPQKFDYVFHEKRGESILLWANVGKKTRLYEFPYDRETQKQLEDAKKAEKEGYPMEGEFLPQKEGNNERSVDQLIFKIKVTKGPKKE